MQYSVPANVGLTVVDARGWIPQGERLLVDITITSATLTGLRLDAAGDPAGAYETIIDGDSLSWSTPAAVAAAGVTFAAYPGVSPIGTESGSSVRLAVSAQDHRSFKLYLSGGTATLRVNARRY